MITPLIPNEQLLHLMGVGGFGAGCRAGNRGDAPSRELERVGRDALNRYPTALEALSHGDPPGRGSLQGRDEMTVWYRALDQFQGNDQRQEDWRRPVAKAVLRKLNREIWR